MEVRKTGKSNWAALKVKVSSGDGGPRKKARVDHKPPQPQPETNKLVALDCEMVSAGPTSMLCRVTLINGAGVTLLDTWVAPVAPITDYRTNLSGCTPESLIGAPQAADVRKRVAALLEGRVVVGHDLRHDFRALQLPMPRARDMRDTARFPPFLSSRGRPRALKCLARNFLERHIQRGKHDPKEDAQAALDLYRMHEAQWEALVADARRAARGKKANK